MKDTTPYQECSACLRLIPDDGRLPICDPCRRTARVAGKQQAQYERTLREEPEVMD